MRDDASPTLSCSSADEALYELLGVNKLCLDQEDENNNEQPIPPSVSCLTPPPSCHRLHTPHDSILLTCSKALSSFQCRHIISKGYQATNDGGVHYGPKYVKEAVHENHSRVELQEPNHHKVCVFMDTMILTWLKRIVKDYLDPYIQAWNSGNSRNYIVNPRLRLLRYDARDGDVFLNHYDATTTTTLEGVEYESKLTILVYLNTEFSGGETAFLNSLHPSEFLDITPTTGQVVVFNHELYHASRELIYDGGITVDKVSGGTKFVLRSDVMFEKQIEVMEPCTTTTCLLDMPTNEATEVKVVNVLSDMDSSDTSTLSDVLDQLDCLHSSVRTFLVPGRGNLTSILTDLGVHQWECNAFLEKCEASLE